MVTVFCGRNQEGVSNFKSFGFKLIYLVLIFSPLLVAAISGPIYFFVVLVFSQVVAILFSILALRSGSFPKYFLAVTPVLISAVQNLYLGLISPSASSVVIQMALLMNILSVLSAVTVFTLFEKNSEIVNSCVKSTLIFMSLVFFSSILSVVFVGFYGVSAISSLRNFISPFLFFMLGVLIAGTFDGLSKYLSSVFIVGWFVLIFGFVERFSGVEFWSLFNLETLWLKKQIPNLSDFGVPANFYSSEKFEGEHLRRMASSFADPVNLGTFLSFLLLASWFERRWFLFFFTIVGIIFTISKGGVLAILVFVSVWAFVEGSRLVKLISIFSTSIIGVGVFLYAFFFSTQSLQAHLSGFYNAILMLPSYPFGLGLGGVGVLAGGDSMVKESGFGVVVGQLGLLGLILFVSLFILILRRAFLEKESRKKIFFVSASISILINILFNEIALSPNSSGVFFTVFGVLWVWSKLHDSNCLEVSLGDSKT